MKRKGTDSLEAVNHFDMKKMGVCMKVRMNGCKRIPPFIPPPLSSNWSFFLVSQSVSLEDSLWRKKREVTPDSEKTQQQKEQRKKEIMLDASPHPSIY
mmetsp:Transcript_29639/g.58168  ORF Transcript_29639/g.58168 Transcript_29639/m.58168 type:complete len:98 (-) Transcript_29639:2138-2431(-)